MSTITKERVAEFIKNPLNNGLTRGEQMELARIALASLEAEPVAWLLSGGGAKNNVSFDSGNAYADPLREVTPLYTAPPAPVSVPYLLEQFAEFMAAESIKSGDYPDGWQCKASNAAHEYAQNIRAAMLQGAEPVTTDYKLPFDQWLSQQTGTIDVECGCVMTEVFFHWLRVAYEAGNSSQCREISNSSTNNFRENAETSTKCWFRTCRPVTFADSHFVVCPECGNKRCPHANDHRHACTGSNEPGQEGSAYPAAPQQEV
ncbi:hypothetical protein ACEVQL_002251 [Enterobacter roggenkampii]